MVGTWSQVVEKDMRECGLKREDAKDRERWRGGEGCWVELPANPCISRENSHKMTVVVLCCTPYIPGDASYSD